MTYSSTALGARVTSLNFNETAIIRKDEGHNPKRSGIPVLGPIVDANTGIWQQIAPKMPQHGTDRITKWIIEEKLPNSTTYVRTYDGTDHPLIGDARITITISKNNGYDIFRLERQTTNRGTSAAPLGTGLHTYFPPQAQFPTLNILPNLFPVENKKTYLLEGMNNIPMIIDGHHFVIETDPTPLHTVVWTEKSDDHICVEAWWARIGDAPLIYPGETRKETYIIRSIVDRV